MAKAPPTYEVREGTVPLWASEPFRVFFPLGILAAVFGLLLWPLHYAGWWPLYPAVQHPRILVFGFGSAFVFGFLGTAWPRFLGSSALSAAEVLLTAAGWLAAVLFYARGSIPGGDVVAAAVAGWFLLVLGRRLFAEGRELPPPGFALAFFAVGLSLAVLLAWSAGWATRSVAWDQFLRLLAYQGFLLLPIFGVGSYLFARFFAPPGGVPSGRPSSGGAPSGRPGKAEGRPARRIRRGLVVWGCAGLVLVSFAIEAWLSPRAGNGLRLVAVVLWSALALPGIWRVRAPGTRAWALRLGLGMAGLAFLLRAVWPSLLFAFEHLLFLGGFSLVILLTADRVVLGHCDDPARVAPRSGLWRWIFWLVVLTAATRATADLVPSTRVSHHIYAALMLAVVLGLWLGMHAKRLRRRPPSSE